MRLLTARLRAILTLRRKAIPNNCALSAPAIHRVRGPAEMDCQMLKRPEVTATSVAERVFTVPEAGEYLRVSRATAFNLIRAKKINPLKIGGRTIIKGSELLRFLKTLEDAA